MDIIKQHDTWPHLEFNFIDASGDPVDCSGYTVRLLVRNKRKQVVINTVIGDPSGNASWIDESLGAGEYAWQAEDTEIAGQYQYEFEFTRDSDGKVFTIPQDTYFFFTVTDDIA